jgi:hypothetical protein
MQPMEEEEELNFQVSLTQWLKKLKSQSFAHKNFSGLPPPPQSYTHVKSLLCLRKPKKITFFLFGQHMVMAKITQSPDAKSAQSFGKNQLGAGPVS